MSHELTGPSSEGKGPKVVHMPSKEDILQRLRTTGLYGVTPRTDIFFDRFIGQVADSEIVGAGLNVAWELASYDTLRAYPPIMRTAVGLSFNRVIDAITPEPEVADDAKAFRQQILDEIKAKTEAEKRPAVEDPSSNFELYVATRRIGDIVHEVAREISHKADTLYIEDRRRENVNPYYNQSETGLFLDFSYGVVHSVWTPWGEWVFRGNTMSDGETQRRLTKGVMEKLETTEYRPQINNEQGSFGPTYGVLKVEGVRLPQPVIRPSNAYLTRDAAHKTWIDFTRRYRRQKIGKVR